MYWESSVYHRSSVLCEHCDAYENWEQFLNLPFSAAGKVLLDPHCHLVSLSACYVFENQQIVTTKFSSSLVIISRLLCT